jgi:D-serine deaminase-like pyridoxal phosphate-dependent protein
MNNSKYQLDTPCLVLDLDILETNLRTMQAAASQAGKNLRPHAKTHKCSALSKKQIEAGAIGVCAAKVSEAQALVKAGIENVLVTGPVATPRKVSRLVDVLSESPTLMAAVDSQAGVDLLAAALRPRRARSGRRAAPHRRKPGPCIGSGQPDPLPARTAPAGHPGLCRAGSAYRFL